MVSKEINEIKLENYQKYDPNLARCGKIVIGNILIF